MTPAKLKAALSQCGIADDDLDSFVLVGLESIDGLKAEQLQKGSTPIDVNETAKQLLSIVRGAKGKSAQLRAVLFESTMLPM